MIKQTYRLSILSFHEKRVSDGRAENLWIVYLKHGSHVILIEESRSQVVKHSQCPIDLIHLEPQLKFDASRAVHHYTECNAISTPLDLGHDFPEGEQLAHIVWAYDCCWESE